MITQTSESNCATKILRMLQAGPAKHSKTRFVSNPHDTSCKTCSRAAQGPGKAQGRPRKGRRMAQRTPWRPRRKKEAQEKPEKRPRGEMRDPGGEEGPERAGAQGPVGPIIPSIGPIIAAVIVFLAAVLVVSAAASIFVSPGMGQKRRGTRGERAPRNK